MFSSKWKLTESGSYRLLTFTIVIIVVSLLPLHEAMAATTWTVTVTYDETNGFHYTVQPNNKDCGYAVNPPSSPDPSTFSVCAKDTVQFKAATPKIKDELMVVIPDRILGTAGITHSPIYERHVSDGKQSKDGFVIGAADGTGHEFFILIVVKDTGASDPTKKFKSKCWDPILIIGTGTGDIYKGQKK